MKAHCEDPDDENSYLRSFDTDQGWAPPSLDWRVSGSYAHHGTCDFEQDTF